MARSLRRTPAAQVTSGIAALALAGAVGAGPAGPANPLATAGQVCASNHGVACFDPASGAMRWRALTGRHTLDLAPGPGLVLVAGSDGLQALALDDGIRRWQISRFGSAFPAQSDGHRVWFGTRAGEVVMAEAAGGRLLWHRDLGDWVYTPALAAGRLVTGGRDARLQALDPVDGAVLWQRELGQELVYRPVRAGAGSILVGTFDGRIRRVAAADGRDLWVAAGATPAYRFAVAGERAFAVRMGGTLEALDLATGRRLWRYRDSADAFTALGAHGSRVWTADEAGWLLVLDAASGRLLARRHLSRPLVGASGHPDRGLLAVTASPLALHEFSASPPRPTRGGSAP